LNTDGSLLEVDRYSGRRRLMSGRDCLGLCMAWTQTRGGVYVLQIMFCTAGLRLGRWILILVVQGNPYSTIKLPSNEKVQEYKADIQKCHPLLTNVCCTMDGLKLTLQAAANNRI
jgi:hypothetical protein